MKNSAYFNQTKSVLQALGSKILLLVLGFQLIGCGSMTGSITDISGSIGPVKLDRASTSGFISGSEHYETTLLNKYKIRAEVGSFEGQIRAKTPNGFTLFSSVEGTIASTEGVK